MRLLSQAHTKACLCDSFRAVMSLKQRSIIAVTVPDILLGDSSGSLPESHFFGKENQHNY